VFPGVSSFTSADSLTVRGKASDQTGIKSITVNGVPVVTSNNWSDWSLKIDNLAVGVNAFTVKAEDSLGQTTEQVVNVEKQLPMFAPSLTALNSEQSQLYIYDSSLNDIFVVDLTTGLRNILPQTKSAEALPFSSPTTMTYDASKNRLLVAQYETSQVEGFTASYRGRIIAIDVQTGTRTLFAEGAILIDISKPSISLRKPTSLTIDPESRTLYVLDEKAGFIGSNQRQLIFDYAILKYPLDSESPSFTRVSDNQINKDEPLTGSLNLRFDNKAKRLITESQFHTEYDSNNNPIAYWFGLVAIDPATGTRTVLSGKNVQSDSKYAFPILTPSDFFVSDGYAYYNDLGAAQRRVLKINLTTGERSEWFTNVASDNKYNFRVITKLEQDTKNQVVFALDAALKAVFKINPQDNFARTPTTSNSTINENTSLNFLSPSSLMWDRQRERILINNGLEGTINTYDLKSGLTSLLCSFGVQNSAVERVIPRNSVLDEHSKRVVSVVAYQYFSEDTVTTTFRLDSCDLASGKHVVISDNTTGKDVVLLYPTQLAVDSTNQKAYTINSIRAIDDSIYTQNTIVEIDLTTGARSVVAPIQPTALDFPRDDPKGGLTFDEITGNIYFSILSNSSIYKLDPKVKTISVMSNNLTDATTPLLIPKMLFMHNQELITLDSARQSLITVKADGKRSTLANLTSSGPNAINQVGGIIIDSENQRIFAADLTLGALTLQDQITGETVFLAK